MCGIAGIVGDPGPQLQDRMQKMLDVQRHRGPDDSGVYLDGPVGLAHARLSILDLTSAGHQPMIVDQGRLVLVYNGEVFNYVELREELEARGHPFFSRSDSEVILRAYDQWGESCVTRFNGMWALGLLDRDRSRLFCSRDRFGVKPFFYAFLNNQFIFASEIKALLAVCPALRVPNNGYVARFLRTSITDDDERTFFANVKRLLPGHSVSVDLTPEGPLMGSPCRYWHFDPDRSRSTYDYTHPDVTLRNLLEDSVRLRLRSDVPVGTCLSGGLDSSSIVALATSQLDVPVWTFSALYPQAAYDESRYVRAVNAAFRTVAHEVWPQPDRLLEVMPRIVWHQDEPSAGPGLYSQWHVMEAASPHVRVLLDGQGADELLGGYDSYYVDYLRSLRHAFLQAPSPAQGARLVAGWAAARNKLGPDLLPQTVLSLLPEHIKSPIRRLAGRHYRPEVRREYSDAWAEDEDPWQVQGPLEDRLSNALYDAVFRRSLPALLRYEDRNSMAFSVEARTPFLDYRLAEFALALPFGERIDGRWTKAVLRRAMAGILPPEITWRPDKMGYPTPFSEWLRREFREDAEDIIYSRGFRERGIFDTHVVDRMWREHVRGVQDNSWNVWRWLSLELWFRMFVDCGS